MSSGYPWFRMYSEARLDVKLRALSRDQHYVWFNLLCLAAEDEPRGTFSVANPEVLALEVADGDTALLTQTLERLRHWGMLTDIGDERLLFTRFDARQYTKPSDRPERVRERVTRHRERVAAEPVTPASLDVTPVTPLETRRNGTTRSGNATEADTDPYADTDPEIQQAASSKQRSASAEWRAAACEELGRERLTPAELGELAALESGGHTLAALRWAIQRARKGAKSTNVLGYAHRCIADAPSSRAPPGQPPYAPQMTNVRDYFRQLEAERGE